MATPRLHLVATDAQDEVVEASVGAPAPLPALELPRARRPGWPTLAALASGCGAVAVGLGTWALVAENRAAPSAPPTSAADASLAILTDSRGERYPLRGSIGRITLVVATGDRAVLALDGLGRAPKGRVYAAWLVRPGSATAVPVGSFDGGERVVPLAASVPPGARVGVTLEPETGVDHPSRSLRLVALRR